LTLKIDVYACEFALVALQSPVSPDFAEVPWITQPQWRR
jgi:hypothetical protein